MKSQDIRQSFIDYFSQHDHQPLASAPLVPQGDPTLMFVNAGMVQFKDIFLGNEEAPHSRAVTAQKCLRVSGKHNDLENVGPSPRHHTFFEMLGNFSFGDYFKEDAIRFAWQLITEVWELPAARLFATVFEDDDEAAKLWRQLSSLPAERIVRCGAKDNFWSMGETGPCGPCSEIFVDLQPELPQIDFHLGNDNGRYVEIWNLVFMQFERTADGQQQPLPNPSIDTGAGLERVAAVLQGVASNYDTDLFQPLLRAAAALAGTEYGRDDRADVSLRVVGDHLRAASFMLADGVIPGPDGRGYVLRRLLRRAVRHGMGLGFEEPFLHRLVPLVGEMLGHHYRELGETETATTATVREEEQKYLNTLASGARRVQEAIEGARQQGRGVLSGEAIFQLYDTYGQELDTVCEIAAEEQLEVDIEGFERHLAARRESSRHTTGELQRRMASLREAVYGVGEPGATEFVGYTATELDGAMVVRLARLDADGSARVATSLGGGERGVAVLDRSVFYAESGGEVGDCGELSWPGGLARVIDTQKDPAGSFFHFLEVERGQLAAGRAVDLRVDGDRRLAIERNHTATHLLHGALHEVLGGAARQAGSLVAAERLRFDFTHPRPVTADELRRIENRVNQQIRRATPTQITERGYDEAREAGAMALFGEKYGDRVRTVEVPGFSLELCGGCHVRNSGEIGLLLLTGERGVASGVRRIEAVTGEGAMTLLRRREALLGEVEASLSTSAERAPQEAAALKKKVKDLEAEVTGLRRKMLSGGSSSAGQSDVEGIQVVAREVPGAAVKELRGLADSMRDKLGSGVVVLASRGEGKVGVVVTVSKDLIGRVHAGKMVAELAAVVGGRGGGRADFAQAGGKQPEQLPELLSAVPRVLSRQLADS